MRNQLPIHGIYDEWEREETARRQQSDRLKDLFKRAKDEGYNAKALRQAFAEQYALDHFTGEKLQKRATDASDVDLYLTALAGVRTREIIEEIPPHDADGVILETSSQAMDVAASAVPFPSHGSLASPAGAEGDEDRQPINAPRYEAAE